MRNDLIVYNLISITEQLTTEEIIFSRRFRNWEEFDKLEESLKLRVRLEELQYWEDKLDENYIPTLFRKN